MREEDSKVWVGVDILEGSIAEGVDEARGLFDTEDVTLAGVEFHSPVSGPSFKLFEVILKLKVVLLGVDGTIEEAVVSE